MNAPLAAVRETTALNLVNPHDIPAAASTALTPMQMAYQLIARGADMASVDAMLAMGERLAADEARRAFNVAFAEFKSEAVKVFRTREVTDGPLKGRRYAELFSFVDAATPALSAHGLSASWSISRDEKDWIEVTCTIEHSLGSKKSVSLGGPPDTGGAKNALQARISTVTYLERATFKAACGLAEQGDDDDGSPPAAAGPTITEEQIIQLRDLIEATAEAGKTKAFTTEFLKWAKVESLAAIPASKYAECVNAIKASRAA